MFSVTVNTLYFGNFPIQLNPDPGDGSGTSFENASALVGTTFGSSADPLFENGVSVTYTDNDLSPSFGPNQINPQAGDVLTYDLGGGSVTSQVMALPVYSFTITYIDGTSATINYTIVQLENGDIFPVQGLGEDDGDFADGPLEAGPIESITVDAVVSASSGGNGLGNINGVDVAIVCYAPGTLIDTPTGPTKVEDLSVGDLVQTRDNGAQQIRWIHSDPHAIDSQGENHPILIKAGALGRNLPTQDLIVSPQHRILVGEAGQLEEFFAEPMLVPAKGLTSLPGIRAMRGKKAITWWHFALDRHEVVTAAGAQTESLLLGRMAVAALPLTDVFKLFDIYRPTNSREAMNGPPARKTLGAGKVRRLLRSRPHLLAA